MNPVILDANSLAMRNIMVSAADDLKAGEVWTGGIFGTLSMFRAFLAAPETRADSLYAFFDGGVPAYRLKLLPGYKSQRKERRARLLTDEQMERAMDQLGLIKEMLGFLGVVCVQYKEREADDACAAAVRLLAGKNTTPVVVSSDKDLLQVINMGGRVWDIANSRWVERENFEEVTGVNPANYLLYKTLVGDPSDSIKGCAGCGDVRARELVEKLIKVCPLFREETVSFDAQPQVQLETVRLWLKRKVEGKRRAFEHNFLADYPRLVNEMKGIDLSNSFGGTSGLSEKLQLRPPVQKMDFLRFCKRLSLQHVLNDPEHFIRPFREAAARRD